MPKRNPKSKRVHDSDSGKFISEEKINDLAPFGYNDEEDGSGIATWLILAILVAAAVWYAQQQGLIAF